MPSKNLHRLIQSKKIDELEKNDKTKEEEIAKLRADLKEIKELLGIEEKPPTP